MNDAHTPRLATRGTVGRAGRQKEGGNKGQAQRIVIKTVDLPVLGCFEGGTPVHIASLAPVPWDLALCTVANEAASEYEWLYGEDQNDGRLYESTRSTQSIEEVTLGSRTVGQNPNRDDYDLVFGLQDENTWRQVHMQLDRDDGVVVDIQLLRPIDWIEASGLYAGGEYHVDLPHTSAKGLARVLEIGPCPWLASGDGNLVIGLKGAQGGAQGATQLYFHGLSLRINSIAK